MNWKQCFLDGVLRDKDGTPSFSRTGSLIGLLAAVFWVSVSLGLHKEIPNLAGPAEWVTAVTFSMYGINQASLAVQTAVKPSDCTPEKGE